MANFAYDSTDRLDEMRMRGREGPENLCTCTSPKNI